MSLVRTGFKFNFLQTQKFASEWLYTWELSYSSNKFADNLNIKASIFHSPCTGSIKYKHDYFKTSSLFFFMLLMLLSHSQKQTLCPCKGYFNFQKSLLSNICTLSILYALLKRSISRCSISEGLFYTPCRLYSQFNFRNKINTL